MTTNKISERDERIKKLEELKKLGINPYPATTDRDHKIAEILDGFEVLEKKGTEFTIAGRIMTKREHGNLTFANIFDGSGKVQIAISKKELSDADSYKTFVKLIDMGDFVEIKGKVFTTHKGEKSVMASAWRLLTKAIAPMPEKWHGLSDEEEILRKRYLDILLNEETRNMFVKRSVFWQSIREFLLNKGFLEVETPVLENTAGGADARPFITHHNALDMDVFLRISCGELWQKKLMVAGYEKVFEIGRIFRNEGISTEHLQDYTQMELYCAYADYTFGMKMVEEMYKYIAEKTFGTLKFKIKGFEVDLGGKWEVYDYTETIKKMTGVDIAGADLKKIEKKLAELKVKYDTEGWNLNRAIDTLWKYCRKQLGGPGFLINVPVMMEPLAKRMEADKNLVERFQVILAGSEMGKGFSELNDPLDQAARFAEQQAMRDAGDEEAQMYDYEFVEALEHGMPPTFGFGVSERLFSFLMDKPVRECQIFPLMRPINKKEDTGPKKSKETKIAVAIINKGLKLEPWQELSTIAHLNAAFGARSGRTLFSHDSIKTKDGENIKLNIQHAIMVKIANSTKDILKLIKKAKENNLEIAEFTSEMIETTNDNAIIEKTKNKKIDEVDYLGVLIFGNRTTTNDLTKNFELFKN